MSTAEDDDSVRDRAAARAARRARAAARERGHPAPQAPPPPAAEPSAVTQGLQFLGHHKIVTGVVVFLVGYWAINGTDVWGLVAVVLLGAVLFNRFIDWDIKRRNPEHETSDERWERKQREKPFVPPRRTQLSPSGTYIQQYVHAKERCTRCYGSKTYTYRVPDGSGGFRDQRAVCGCEDGWARPDHKLEWVPVEIAVDSRRYPGAHRRYSLKHN